MKARNCVNITRRTHRILGFVTRWQERMTNPQERLRGRVREARPYHALIMRPSAAIET